MLIMNNNHDTRYIVAHANPWKGKVFILFYKNIRSIDRMEIPEIQDNSKNMARLTNHTFKIIRIFSARKLENFRFYALQYGYLAPFRCILVLFDKN